MNFRQIHTFVAVYEESSFSRAAEREHTTQSGLSMQIKNLEAAMRIRLFERTSKGVIPTQAGEMLYRRASAILHSMSEAQAEMEGLVDEISGRIRIGLMPAFTHGILAPALASFMDRHPKVDVTIIEAYSPTLSEGVLKGDFDFAVVPIEPRRSGIRSRHFGVDWELLVSAPDSPLQHLAPVALAELPPLKLVLPTHGNARRERLELFFAAHHVAIDSLLEMDAMIATLEFVAHTEWMTILPATICSKDLSGKERKLHPIVSPQASVDYMLIEPARQSLSPSSGLFSETLQEHFQRIHHQWESILEAAT
ncbi:MAG: LysR family transcriptional regulator [Gammaproteobacteria bacterium]